MSKHSEQIVDSIIMGNQDKAKKALGDLVTEEASSPISVSVGYENISDISDVDHLQKKLAGSLNVSVDAVELLLDGDSKRIVVTIDDPSVDSDTAEKELKALVGMK